MHPISTLKAKFSSYKKSIFGPILNRAHLEIEGEIVGNEKEFEYVSMPQHGSHQLAILKNILTGQFFVQKYLNSPSVTAKEYILGLFLHAIYSHHPKPFLLEDSKSRVSLLSRMKSNTQDLEQFIRAERTSELLNKKVIGLADAFLIAGWVGKLSDQKFANIIVKTCFTDANNNIVPQSSEGAAETLVFSSIDNERSHFPTHNFCNSGKIKYIVDPKVLLNTVYDIDPPSEENHAGLAGDIRAKEFVQAALKILTKADIKNAYLRLANVELEPVHETCLKLERNSGFFKGKNSCDAYNKHFKNIKEEATKVLETQFLS